MQLKSPSVGDDEVRRPRGVQKDDVWTAADAILLEGGKPTIERVRQRLGTGSPNTVGPLLETWFKSLGQRLRSQEDPDASDGVPGPVMQAAHHLWKAALAETQEDLEERVLQGLADAVANVEAEKEKAHIASSAAFEATAKANRLEKELADCNRLQQQVQQDLAAERASAQEVRVALAKEQDRLVEERHSAAEQLADLKVQLAAAIQRADAADRRVAMELDRERSARAKAERLAQSLQKMLEEARNAEASTSERLLEKLEEGRQRAETLATRLALAEAELATRQRLAELRSLDESMVALLTNALPDVVGLKESVQRLNMLMDGATPKGSRPKNSPQQAGSTPLTGKVNSLRTKPR